MRASKEECRAAAKALECVEEVLTTEQWGEIQPCLDRLATFLDVAVKRLPSEAAYDHQRQQAALRSRRKRG